MSTFDFKLNAYDQATQSDSPFNAGYPAARRSLVSHIAELEQQLEAARKDAERWRAVDKFSLDNDSAGCDLLTLARTMAIAAGIDRLSVEYDGADTLIDAAIAASKAGVKP